MITLFGHGYIGEHIVETLTQQNIPHTSLHHTQLQYTPDNTTVIINAAGYTGSPNVDACEIYKQETINGNVIWPLILEQRFPHIPIIHISSGCVYTGYPHNGFRELDPPNFDFNNGSFYSGSKNLAQQLLTPYLHKSYLFRIRMPFGDTPHPKNLLTKYNTYKKLIDFENSLTYINDLTATVIHFAKTLPPMGIYNVCNPGSKTTRQITEMMNIEKEWFTLEEFNNSIKTPRSNCILNTDKLQNIFPLQSVDDALHTAIQHMTSHV